MRRIGTVLLVALALALPAAASVGQTLPSDHFKQAPPAPPKKPAVVRVKPRPPSTAVEAAGATLRGLDKMTGKLTTFSVSVGESRDYERLTVTLRSCRHPPDDTDAVAWLSITDRRDPEPVFRGWMFASSPALSALDHPRYDVWVLSCRTSSTEASTGKAQN